MPEENTTPTENAEEQSVLAKSEPANEAPASDAVVAAPTAAKPKNTGLIATIIIVSALLIAAIVVIIIIAINSGNKSDNGDSGNSNSGNSSNNSGNNGGNSGNNGGNSGNNGGNSGNNGGGSNSASDLVGVWKISSVTEEGFTISGDSLEQFGFSGTVTFNKDGTGSVSMFGSDDSEFTYDADKKTMTDKESGESISFTLNNGKLSIEVEEGTVMVLEKK